MNLTLLDLQARQSELISTILRLRWRKLKREASRDELRELRKLEREFAEANARLKRRKQRSERR